MAYMNHVDPSADGGSRAAVDRSPTHPLGLPVLALLGLVALVIPRLVVHDLGLIPPGSPVNALLNVVPLVTWVVVAAVWSRRPLVSLLAVGLGYGVVLAVVHNLAWGSVFGVPPQLGGRLEGLLDGASQDVLLRSAASVSSLVTGLVTGLVCGLLAMGLQALLRRGGIDRGQTAP
jgi:hypothetical protein